MKVLSKTLVLFAHPYFEYSRTNARLVQAYQGLEHVTFRDLYEEYPDFNILTYIERKRLVYYDRLIFHFPLIWFGMPPLLKLWIDDVFNLKWFNEKKDKNPIFGKRADVIVTVDTIYGEYTKDEPLPLDSAHFLTTLVRCLKINNMTIENFLTINNADNLTTSELEDYFIRIKTIAQNT